MHPRVFYSNRLEWLGDQLGRLLFGSGSPFTRRWVVVPTPALKSWVQQHLASQLGIVAGIRFFFLEEAVRELSGPAINCVPSKQELALRIECLLQRFQNDPRFESVTPFWKVNPTRRLPALSNQLATYVVEYGLYGAQMVESWTGENWQEVLWLTLQDEGVGHYSAVLKRLDPQPLCDQLHLFSFSHLPPIFYRFLQKMTPVWYVVSPCVAFWADVQSDREARTLLRMHRQRGVAEGRVLELASYLRARNRLLGNFGRLGRQMVTLLEDEPSAETYFFPKSLISQSPYAETISEDLLLEEDQTTTALGVIQADMLVLRHACLAEAVALPSEDDSIQVHGAPSRWREVEVLAQVLRESLADSPGSVLVMAPNISDYAPFIRATFQGEWRAQIQDLTNPDADSVEAGILQLIRLSRSRWDFSEVMRTLEHPRVLKQLGWKEEDLDKVERLITEAGIRWGRDQAHAQRCLQREYGEVVLYDPALEGTWEKGIERLLRSMASGDPVPWIELSEMGLLAGLVVLMRDLAPLLEPLVEGSMTVEQWADHLDQLCLQWLGSLCPGSESLRRLARRVGEQQFGFESIRSIITAWEGGVLRGHDLGAIRFCSMVPMKAIPAKIICLLGMHEGAFPRSASKQPLNLLHTNRIVDPHPSQNDLDRYLFLEALLAARKQFIITYCNRADDGQEQGPSLLVSELLSVLKQSVRVGDEPPRSLIRNHPQLACDKTYFSLENRQPWTQFRRAQLLTGKRSACSPPATIRAREGSIVTSLKISELCSSLRDPIALFLKRALRLSVPAPLHRKQLDFDPLIVSPLKGNRLIWLNEPPPGWLLPPAPFKSGAEQLIGKRRREIQEGLQIKAIASKSVLSIELVLGLQKLMESQGRWFCPCPQIAGLPIEGCLDHASTGGLIYSGNCDLESIVGHWPRFLLYALIAERVGLPQEVLLVREGKWKKLPERPQILLQGVVEYYHHCLAQPIPFSSRIANKVIRLRSYSRELLAADMTLSYPTRWWLQNREVQGEEGLQPLLAVLEGVDQWL